ncbi:ABC transporter permease [Halalkalicoccus jeotgali]|uniref:ABC-2 type transporter n=1 Tax=Halalkalicoccus jeotgali (strain DSM 18796 / CECT 7217 / JCM 14584 / KCTC 4019 / B3) TaxID=795797 RepID=D8J5B3_HALJB|nr:ABC transporter permease [Halalkalicoccus jeotgali]ADJ13694.1 ABC-2 type transporter [Halalkalicoccus jeotgali B3]ELY34259.1 ABC-2 type transporter [Halalkalicoccus jeotgali B3]
MSAIAIAKKDFQDAVRSRGLIALTVIFVLFTVAGAYIGTQVAGLLGDEAGDTLDLIIGLQTPASFLVPIIALLIGYGAVAGERESGSLKFLLGLPHTRQDVVLGKVLGRTGVVAVSILIGFIAGMIAIFAFTGSFSPVEYAIFTLLTIALGFVYVCIGVGLSAMTKSTTRAAVGAFGLLALFWILWSVLAQLLLYLTSGSVFPEPPIPGWYVAFLSLPPGPAYGSALGAILDEGGLAVASTYEGQGLVEGGIPIVAEPWFGFVLLAAWAFVPLALGLLRFDRVDL